MKTLQAILWNLIENGAMRQGMYHEFGLFQWDSKTKFGGPAHLLPKGGHRMNNGGPSTLKTLRSVLETHRT